jgi:hypothetical protein
MNGIKKQDAPLEPESEPDQTPPSEPEDEAIAIELPHEDGDENAQPG